MWGERQLEGEPERGLGRSGGELQGVDGRAHLAAIGRLPGGLFRRSLRTRGHALQQVQLLGACQVLAGALGDECIAGSEGDVHRVPSSHLPTKRSFCLPS